MANTKPDRVRFEYRFDKLYNPIYVNGAWGGLTPQGEICINFFLERTPLPLDHTHTISEDGAIGPNISPVSTGPEGEPLFIRFISTGVVMNLETSKKIVDFLQKQIAAHEMMTTAIDPTKEAH